MKISIITINYNDSVGLNNTIQSVIKQSFNDFEFIVIDGASTDGSKQVIEANSNHINYWVSEPDAGIYNAMNKGIKAAKGDYLLFLNSGDSFYSDTVLEAVNEELGVNSDVFYGDVIRLHTNGTQQRKSYPNQLSFKFFVDSALAHQATFIKRELFTRFFYYDESYKILADWNFLIYAICKENVSYKHLPIVISNYDMDGISSQESSKEVMRKERMQTYKDYFPLFLNDYMQDINNATSLNSTSQKELRIKSSKLLKPLYLGVVNTLFSVLKLKEKFL